MPQKRKRGSAPKFPETERNANLKSVFSELFVGAKYQYFTPSHCTLFTRTRTITQSGISKLMHLFDRQSGEDGTPDSVAHESGSDTSIVVHYIVVSHALLQDSSKRTVTMMLIFRKS